MKLEFAWGNKKKARTTTAASLPVIRPNVAGVDVGSTEHWVCGPQGADGKPNVEVFGTTTPELERLANWLVEQAVESVAMESTYVYWIPVYELLEDRGLEVLLVNARHFRNVPGRKTDMRDCQWIQLLHSCGLLRGSFRPTEEIGSLRAMQRQMENLVADRTRYVQWMQKALDQMNVQVHRASALRMYDAVEAEIAAYEASMLDKLEQLQPPERRDEPPPSSPNASKEKAITRRGEMKKRTTLFRFAGIDLTLIDGIGVGAATTILTEIGPDLSAFPSEKDSVTGCVCAPGLRSPAASRYENAATRSAPAASAASYEWLRCLWRDRARRRASTTVIPAARRASGSSSRKRAVARARSAARAARPAQPGAGESKRRAEGMTVVRPATRRGQTQIEQLEGSFRLA